MTANEFMERMAKLSHRANVAMCTAMAEWVVWRFEKLSTDDVPHRFIEAAWASGVHLAYARYVEFNDDSRCGVVRCPLRIAIAILVDLIWGLYDTIPGKNVSWMNNLTELVLTDQNPFRQWREQCILLLEKYHLIPVNAIFSLTGTLFSQEIPKTTKDSSKSNYDPMHHSE